MDVLCPKVGRLPIEEHQCVIVEKLKYLITPQLDTTTVCFDIQTLGSDKKDIFPEDGKLIAIILCVMKNFHEQNLNNHIFPNSLELPVTYVKSKSNPSYWYLYSE